MNDLSGQSFGRYHLVEKLGEGGMAVVYKAFDTRLECDVAVKVIRLDNLPQNSIENTLKRFEREAKAVARLTHANIVKVTDYGHFEETPYLVMEYLPSGTLKDYLHKNGQIPWQHAVTLIVPIAEALAYAHSMKVLHRDVKPSNILLTQTMQPMLTDFGIAKILDEENPQELTGTGIAIGTPEYMAPEQVTSKTTDARADIYALGVVFYEMVTGRRPFEADTPMAVLFKHASEPLPRPSSLVRDLPMNVENFIFKATAKDPNQRYQSMDEFVSALGKLQSVIPAVPDKSASIPVPIPAPTPAPTMAPAVNSVPTPIPAPVPTPVPAPAVKSVSAPASFSIPETPSVLTSATTMQPETSGAVEKAITPPPMPIKNLQNPPSQPTVMSTPPPQPLPQAPAIPAVPGVPVKPKKRLSAGKIVLIIIGSILLYFILSFIVTILTTL